MITQPSLKENLINEFNKEFSFLKDRFEIIELQCLKNFFMSPTYYNINLTREDVNLVIKEFISFLELENFEISLATESIILPYSISSDSVTILGEKRNTNEMYNDRINSIQIFDEILIRTFESDFWNRYRNIDLQFRDKSFVINWFRKQL